MAKKYLKRVEDVVERFGNVREAYEYEVGLLLERVARVEREHNVIVNVDELLPQRAMDIAGGELHYRERRKWVEDVVRIREEQILAHAQPREMPELENEPDTEIENPLDDNDVSQNDTKPDDKQDRNYPDDDSWFNPDEDENEEESDDYGYPESDDGEDDDIYEPPTELPPSLAEIQLNNLADQLDEYGDVPLVDDVRDVIDRAIEEQGKETVGSRINANFSKLQKNLDNAIIYEDDRHKFNYFMGEVLKCIRGYGFTKEENIEATEEAEKAGSVNPN